MGHAGADRGGHDHHRRAIDLELFGQAFALVSLAVPILRKRRPDLERSFKVPFSPVLPILAAVVCAYLALNLSIETWLRFLIWMAVGFVIYFTYGVRNSRLARRGAQDAEPART